MKLEELTIGEEYIYIGQFVKVVEINCDEVTVETRFCEYATCKVSELRQKPARMG